MGSKFRDKKRKTSKEPQIDLEMLKEVYTNPFEFVIKQLSKKMRNVNKKLDRLNVIQEKINSGIDVEAEQRIAISKRKEVEAQIEIAKEFLATVESSQKQQEQA